MTYIDFHSHNRGSDPHILTIQYVYPEQLPDIEKLPAAFSSGIHPWFLTSENFTIQLRLIEQFCSDPRCAALGESGLDAVCQVSMSLQLQAFRQMIHLSEQYAKPLIIHCVKAFDELLSLKKELSPRQPWIIHGFRGKPQQAHQLLEKGIYLSFGEKFNPATVTTVPAGHFFIESDEKKRDISFLYKQIAEIRSVSEEGLRQEIFNLAKDVFGEQFFCNLFKK